MRDGLCEAGGQHDAPEEGGLSHYFRASATNSSGTGTGEILSFTTSVIPIRRLTGTLDGDATLTGTLDGTASITATLDGDAALTATLNG